MTDATSPMGIEGGLKPCPFCGGEATLRFDACEEAWDVCCYVCDTRQAAWTDKGDAIAAWNTRASPPPAQNLSSADGEWVLVPRKLVEDALRDLLSPFPREVQVVASLGMGDTSIERLQAALSAAPPPLVGRMAKLQSVAATGTAEAFLSCDDHTKRLMFAQFIEDSERRKRAEQALARAREYVVDTLDAHEHSDGRELLNEIDAILSVLSPVLGGGEKS